MANAKLAAIILTKNEERNLPGCLASLEGLADEVYVIDSGSSDKTARIADEAGAIVLTHDFHNYAIQFNWAIENIPGEANWLLRIDADERIGPQMRDSILGAIAGASEELNGIMLARRTEFLGKRLQFGGTFPIWLLRVWRRETGFCEDRWMDEHIVLKQGEVAYSTGELLHLIPDSLAAWSRKHVWYAERECLDVVAEASAGSLQGQAGLKRNAKTKLYYRLPMGLRVIAFFIYRYLFQLGFLDGKIGFFYHFLQCAWYRMLVDGLLMERRLSTALAAENSTPSEADGR
jgi:glycosyltransferase involved in cell wall biosynthesis